MVEERQDRALNWPLVALVVAAIALIAIGAFLVLSDGGSSEAIVGRIELSEFEIEGDLTLAPGRVELDVKNIGVTLHNLVKVDTGDRTPDLNSDEVYLLELGVLEPGEYRLICDIPGHEEAGMVATLVIEEDAASTGEAGADDELG